MKLNSDLRARCGGETGAGQPTRRPKIFRLPPESLCYVNAPRSGANPEFAWRWKCKSKAQRN